MSETSTEPSFFKQLFSFPNPVDETSARIVATGVISMVALFAIVGSGWLLVPLLYGFIARVATGPSLSLLGQLATRVISPRIGGAHKQVPGPPKRFAQSLGVVFSGVAAVAWLLGAPTVTYVALGMLFVAAGLEAAFAFCLGCIVYAQIWGCADCEDISWRLGPDESAPDRQSVAA